MIKEDEEAYRPRDYYFGRLQIKKKPLGHLPIYKFFRKLGKKKGTTKFQILIKQIREKGWQNNFPTSKKKKETTAGVPTTKNFK